MSEVSGRALWPVQQMARRLNLPLADLTHGLHETYSPLKSPQRRIAWDDFCTLLERVEIQCGGPTDFLRAIPSLALYPNLRGFRAILGAILGLPSIYREVSKWVGGPSFSIVESHYEALTKSQVRITLRIPNAFRDSPQFFRMHLRNLETIPRMFGREEASIQFSLEPRCGIYIISLPHSSMPHRLGRAIGREFSARSLIQDLESQQDELAAEQALLQARYEQLQQAHYDVALQSEHLQMVSFLAKELAQNREVQSLAEAVARRLMQRVQCSGLCLWLRDSDGSERMVRWQGEHNGPFSREIPLERGGEQLGGIRIWGLADEEVDWDPPLDDLIPWIVIALENAHAFTVQRQYQEDLTKVVNERTAELRHTAERLEEALRLQTQLDQQRTHFFANASHELRTPLTLMISPLETLLDTAQMEDEVRDELRRVIHSGYRMTKLVNDLLDLSKLEAGKMRLQLTLTDLARLLDEVVRAWQPTLEKRGIQLSLSLPPTLRMVGDPERLEQVALNLVSNAVKYTPDGGRLKIWAERRTGCAHFVVENSGSGIDPSDMPRLFDRFAASVHTKGRRFGSTGLGLPVVRELVELHGGRVEVTNVPGERVAFQVTLPLGVVPERADSAEILRPSLLELRQYEAIGTPEPVAEPSKPIGWSERPVILVAEDNIELRAFLARGLSDRFEVLSAEDGAMALQLAQEHLPDVIVSDLMMPEIDGAELCRRLKASPLTQAIPFILLSARGELETRLIGLDGGADDFLVKPFNLQEVKLRIQGQLRMRMLTRRASQHEKLAALGTVVAGVAHEVRNPLNGILNSLGPLRALVGGQREATELVDLALQGARQVDRISGQLLRQARAGDGERTVVNLSENVGLALQLLAHKTSQGPRIVQTMHDDESVVLAEPGALNQVWINLLDNAIDAAGPAGEVQVHIQSTKEHAVVEVFDNGPGIAPKVLTRIFDPFFTTKDVGKGTGLGLSLVREIVNQHGGTVVVHSSLGGGSRFRVSLPVFSR